MLLFVVHPASTGFSVDSITPPPLEIVAIIPARYASTRFPGKALERHRRTSDDRARLPARRVVAARSSRVIVATDDLRIATTVTGFGGNVRLTRAHETGTDRLAEVAASLDCDVVVNVQGDEPLIDPRAITEAVAAVQRSDDSDDDALPADPQSRRADQSQRRQGRAGPGRFCTVFLAGAHPPHARSARRMAAALQTYRPVRLPAQCPDGARVARTDPARACRVARAAAGARARHSHQGRGNRLRLHRRGYARGPGTGAAPVRARRRRADHDQIHLRDRWRGFILGEGTRGGVDRSHPRGTRLQGHPAEVRSLHQRRSGHDEPVPARRGVRHRRRRRRPTSISATTNASPTRPPAATRTGRPGRFTRA